MTSSHIVARLAFNDVIDTNCFAESIVRIDGGVMPSVSSLPLSLFLPLSQGFYIIPSHDESILSEYSPLQRT
jgi:hypothetical protein